VIAAPSALDAPWLAPQIEQLRRARCANRYPTGLLIHDERGAGGEALARFAAQLALCRQPDAPCGRCRDCRMFGAAQHPDFIEVHPIEDSKMIRVEQVRELSEQLVLTSHGGGATVALISPADSMNANAANALLKSLEEPRAAVTLILVSAAPSRLPATILSRCLRLRVVTPARAASVAWLERHKGPGPWSTVLDVLGDAPFEALEADPAELARLTRQIRQEGIHALFLDSITDPRAMQQVAKETGASIGGTLYGDALSKPGGEADTYLKMLRHDVTTLKAGMMKN